MSEAHIEKVKEQIAARKAFRMLKEQKGMYAEYYAKLSEKEQAFVNQMIENKVNNEMWDYWNGDEISEETKERIAIVTVLEKWTMIGAFRHSISQTIRQAAQSVPKTEEEIVQALKLTKTAAILYAIKEPIATSVLLEAIPFTKRCNRYFVQPPNSIEMFPIEVQEAFVKADWDHFRYFKKPGWTVQRAVLATFPNHISSRDKFTEVLESEHIFIAKNSPGNLYYIDRPCLEAQWIAVKEHTRNFTYLKNPHTSVTCYCLQKEPNLIRWVKKPSEAEQVLVVSKDPTALKHIEKPHAHVVALAVAQDWHAIRLVKSFIEPYVDYEDCRMHHRELSDIIFLKQNQVIKQAALSHNLSESYQLNIAENFPQYIGFVSNPTVAVQKKVIEKKSRLFHDLQCVDEQVEEEYLENRAFIYESDDDY